MGVSGRAVLMLCGVAVSGCGAEVVEEDKPETAEQAREDIPRRYATWQEACEWMSDWERLKGNNGLGSCEESLIGKGKGIDCATPPVSNECAETLRRVYACNALGLEQSIVPLAQQHCGLSVDTCLPENLEVIDGEPRAFEDTAALWDDFTECLEQRPDG